LACYALLWLMRQSGPGHRHEPAWSGGSAPPPPWLPFGDPTTQIGAVSFAEPVRRILGSGDPWPVLLSTGGLLQTSLLRLTDGLRRAAGVAGRPGLPGSVAITLAVLVLAVAVWLVAS
jgi:hypothetical protein